MRKGMVLPCTKSPIPQMTAPLIIPVTRWAACSPQPVTLPTRLLALSPSLADGAAIPACAALRPPAWRLHHPRHLPGRSENAHLAKPLHLCPQQPCALRQPQRSPAGRGRPPRAGHNQPGKHPGQLQARAQQAKAQRRRLRRRGKHRALRRRRWRLGGAGALRPLPIRAAVLQEPGCESDG